MAQFEGTELHVLPDYIVPLAHVSPGAAHPEILKAVGAAQLAKMRVAKAKERVDKANEEVVPASQARNDPQARLARAEQKLACFGAEEIRLRGRIAGEAYFDVKSGPFLPGAATLDL